MVFGTLIPVEFGKQLCLQTREMSIIGAPLHDVRSALELVLTSLGSSAGIAA
jgi:hypothetical protein